MRLIGSLENEKQAMRFYSFLLKEGIHCTYELFTDPKTGKHEARIWIYEEDTLDDAIHWLEEFQKNPEDPRFVENVLPISMIPPEPIEKSIGQQDKAKKGLANIKVQIKLRPPTAIYPFTYFIILICSMLYLWDSVQRSALTKRSGPVAEQIGFTPIQRAFMFDYSLFQQKIDEILASDRFYDHASNDLTAEQEKQQITEEVENIPNWRGLLGLINQKSKPTEAPILFRKIREGEFWRLFTPCLLHGGLLHILFNMAWAWLLCKQIEARLKRWKMAILIILIAVLSNVAQYFMSGPNFLGFSGVVFGLVGFIWVREKVAPWEGYSLPRSVFIFILVFIIAMVLLELVTLMIQTFEWLQISANIANTAHIVGGLTGMLLAKVPFFSRGES